MLIINGLSIKYKDNQPILSNFNLKVQEKEVVMLVGSSGAGKTSIVNAILGMLPEDLAEVQGEILLNQVPILQNNDKINRNLRSEYVSIMPQDAKATLNPTMKIGAQLSLIFKKNQKSTKRENKRMILEKISKVGFTNAEKIYKSYPHELSGGMAQRCILIAALITNPKLLILDEPTASIDDESVKKMLFILKAYQQETNCGILIITHQPEKIITIFENTKIVEVGDRSD